MLKNWNVLLDTFYSYESWLAGPSNLNECLVPDLFLDKYPVPGTRSKNALIY